MKKDDITYIESILHKKESATLEFKATYNKEQVGMVICSFLNGKGGRVVIGSDENQQIKGVTKADEKADEIARFLEKEIVPEPAVSVDIKSFKGKKLILVNVWQGTNQCKPVQPNWPNLYTAIRKEISVGRPSLQLKLSWMPLT
jgi:ATP-dependent DNA helicase RecG